MENEEISTSTECSMLSKNPIQLKQLIDRVVEVTTVDKKIVGRVYTIDPVTNSLILFNAEESVLIVTGHAVKQIDVSSIDNIPRVNIFSSNKESVVDNSSETTRIRLKNWLLKNRIPIEEDGDVLIVSNSLSIYPPYGCDQCVCINPIMLDKIQRLMTTMPEAITA